MSTVHIVFRGDGEYEGYEEIPIAAYTRREDAEAHADKAQRWLKDNSRWSSRAFRTLPLKKDQGPNPYDPDSSLDAATSWGVRFDIPLDPPPPEVDQ